MTAVIWTTQWCGYCQMAKQVLKEHKIEFEERNIDEGTWTKKDLREAVPDAKTVPQIFIDDEYVGGYDKLMVYMKERNNVET